VVRTRAIRRRRAVAGAVLLVVFVLGLERLLAGGGLSGPPPASTVGPPPPGDPFVYRAARQAAFEARAASGSAQALFTKSPGGIVATAARVAAWRGAADDAVHGTDIPPALLEGLVFLESAGRPDAIAGGSVSGAVGLTQILPGTAQSLLGMHVDVARSAHLTAQIAAASGRGQVRRVALLERLRMAADQRFDPHVSLRAAVRYLRIAEGYLHRPDLAVVAYHAGVGNVQNVLGDFDAGGIVSYARLYFSISPLEHPAAYSLLSSLGDDSDLYLWRVLAAEQVMRLYRSDRAALARVTALETAYPSDALVLVPPGTVARYADPGALSDAYRSGALVRLPADPGALGLAYASSIGALAAHRLGVPRALYYGLRPAARSMLIELAAMVRRVSGVAAPLTLTSAVMDARYDRELGFDDPPATTGYTFQIARRYASGAQATAFQFALDRLQALNLIAWTRGTSTIEITVAPDAARVIAHGV
jgi:hypothetical protein